MTLPDESYSPAFRIANSSDGLIVDWKDQQADLRKIEAATSVPSLRQMARAINATVTLTGLDAIATATEVPYVSEALIPLIGVSVLGKVSESVLKLRAKRQVHATYNNDYSPTGMLKRAKAGNQAVFIESGQYTVPSHTVVEAFNDKFSGFETKLTFGQTALIAETLNLNIESPGRNFHEAIKSRRPSKMLPQHWPVHFNPSTNIASVLSSMSPQTSDKVLEGGIEILTEMQSAQSELKELPEISFQDSGLLSLSDRTLKEELQEDPIATIFSCYVGFAALCIDQQRIEVSSKLDPYRQTAIES